MIMYAIGKRHEFLLKKGEGVVVCNNDEQTPSISLVSGSSNNMTDATVGTNTGINANNKTNIKKMLVVKRKKGQIPFGSFTILEYYKYQRALVDEKPLDKTAIVKRLNKVGLKKRVGTKLKKLTAVEFRALTLSIKMQDDTKDTYLNFEGLKYCRKNKKRLHTFLTRLDKSYNVFVNLSDNRFVPKCRG